MKEKKTVMENLLVLPVGISESEEGSELTLVEGSQGQSRGL
jgi:hypothetical protein